MVNSLFSNNKPLFSIIEEDTEDENYLDNTLSEEYTFTAVSTDNNLQDGSIVSDHIVNKPFETRISGLISNTPIEWEISNNLTRSKEFYEKLKEIRNSKTLLTLVTGLDTFHNMMLQQIHIVRDKDKGQDLFVDLSFKQLKIVEIKTKSLTQSEVQEVVKSGTAEPENKGVVQPSEVKDQSILKKIWG